MRQHVPIYLDQRTIALVDELARHHQVQRGRMIRAIVEKYCKQATDRAVERLAKRGTLHPTEALRLALAAGSRRAETNEDLAQCEASQSGPKGNAQPLSAKSEEGSGK